METAVLELDSFEVMRATRQKREDEEWYLLVLVGKDGTEHGVLITPMQRDDLASALSRDASSTA
jgi:hypothetical protein